MTDHHIRMLTRFQAGARDALYFSSNGFAMAPAVTRKNLAELLGFEVLSKAEAGAYQITAKGIKALKAAAQTFAVSASRITNGTTLGAYMPPVWPLRAGANDNQKFFSIGF